MTTRLGALCLSTPNSRLVSRNGARWLTANVVSNPSAVTLRCISITPALLTSTSRRSWPARKRSAAPRTDSSEARSACRTSTASLPVLARIWADTASSAEGLRPRTTTDRPMPASVCAVARPIPDVAPVTRQTALSIIAVPRLACCEPWPTSPCSVNGPAGRAGRGERQGVIGTLDLTEQDPSTQPTAGFQDVRVHRGGGTCSGEDQPLKHDQVPSTGGTTATWTRRGPLLTAMKVQQRRAQRRPAVSQGRRLALPARAKLAMPFGGQQRLVDVVAVGSSVSTTGSRAWGEGRQDRVEAGGSSTDREAALMVPLLPAFIFPGPLAIPERAVRPCSSALAAG